MSEKTEINSYLTYKLGDETFATQVGSITKILEMKDITKVPGTPDFMKGIINLRGRVLPVIDTRIKLGFPAADYTKNTCIVVMELNFEKTTELVGAIVDAVLQVKKVHSKDIQGPPSLGKKYKSDYITGVFKNKEEFIIIIDINKIFTREEIINLSNK